VSVCDLSGLVIKGNSIWNYSLEDSFVEWCGYYPTLYIMRVCSFELPTGVHRFKTAQLILIGRFSKTSNLSLTVSFVYVSCCLDLKPEVHPKYL
jgi:hypothetical protein